MILFYNYSVSTANRFLNAFSFLLLCCKIMPIPKWNNVYDLWLGTKNE